MNQCNYNSFSALAKINDPELLYDALLEHIAEQYTEQLQIEIYEHADNQWGYISRVGSLDRDIPDDTCRILINKYGTGGNDTWFYDSSLEGWLLGYKPIISKLIVLFVKSSSSTPLVDDEYLQYLFQFYCHHLQMLEGTYRDALTGLYNRRAFNEKMVHLLEMHDTVTRRKINVTPTIFAMLDIDNFKRINDNFGHLYGDEVLLILSGLMTESFRENDLLFRYGGEEFAIVMMNITGEQAESSLQRFRGKISRYKFPNIDQVTISIGYTLFEQSFSTDELIGKADAALYYCKLTTRNTVHDYYQLVDKGLIAEIKEIKESEVEIF